MQSPSVGHGMEIYIGNLPRYAAVSHLDRFFRGFGHTSHFRILEKVLDNGEVMRFAHGVIEPDMAARRAIERLDGKPLLGTPVEVRPYCHRAPQDRRANSPERLTESEEARTRKERRHRGRFRPAPTSWR